MNATTPVTDFLEDLFEHEVKCESPSCHIGQLVCGREVVSLRSAHNQEHKVCKTVSDYDGTCLICGEDAKKCWTIRPI